jgi:hypothetical protein
MSKLFTEENIEDLKDFKTKVTILEHKFEERVVDVVTAIMKAYNETDFSFHSYFPDGYRFTMNEKEGTVFHDVQPRHGGRPFFYIDDEGNEFRIKNVFPIHWLWTDFTEELGRGAKRGLEKEEKRVAEKAGKMKDLRVSKLKRDLARLTPEEREELGIS